MYPKRVKVAQNRLRESGEKRAENAKNKNFNSFNRCFDTYSSLYHKDYMYQLNSDSKVPDLKVLTSRYIMGKNRIINVFE